MGTSAIRQCVWRRDETQRIKMSLAEPLRVNSHEGSFSQQRRGRGGRARCEYVLAGLVLFLTLVSASCGGSSTFPPLSPDFSVGLSTTSVSTQVGGTTAPVT